MLNFLYMNGYGAYVFSSYGIVLAGLLMLSIPPLQRWRRYKKEQQK